jgi:hypothetical protein
MLFSSLFGLFLPVKRRIVWNRDPVGLEFPLERSFEPMIRLAKLIKRKSKRNVPASIKKTKTIKRQNPTRIKNIPMRGLISDRICLL